MTESLEELSQLWCLADLQDPGGERLKYAAAALVLGSMRATAGRGFGWHHRQVAQALDRDALAFAHDRFGRFTGFVLWTPGPEASDVTILDLQAGFGVCRELLHRAARGAGCGIGAVHYERRRGDVARRRVRQPRGRWWRVAGTPDRARFDRLREGAHAGLLHSAAADLLEALELGEMLHAVRDSHAELPLPEVVGRLRKARQMRQVLIARDAEGCASAFLTWAWLDASRVQALERVGPGHWQLDDWNEGDRLVIVDQVVIHGGPDALAELHDRLPPSHTRYLLVQVAPGTDRPQWNLRTLPSPEHAHA